MDAYSRHKKFINDYVLFYGDAAEYCKPIQPSRTDYDVLQETYKFIRTEEDNDDSDWQKKMAKKYYDKLFREYCLADLTRFKEGKIGLRWRIEKEVFSGKGHFICGNKKCDSNESLKSFEVNFAYVENGEKKNALVKLRLCPPCGRMLNYKHEKKKLEKENEKKKHSRNEHESSSEEEEKTNPKKRKQNHQGSSETPQKENEVSEKSREKQGEDLFAGLFP